MSTLATETPAIRTARDIRDWIVGAVAHAIGVDPSRINAAAPLDSLGVDSLAAIGLTGDFAAWLNRDVPATLMWDYPTIDAIATALGEAKPEPRVIPGLIDLQPRGERTPIFFFPGLGGHPVTFTHLASHLGDDQPCYGLTVPGLDGKQPPLTSVEEIAVAMIATIREAQPHGPYQLAGYSFGGLLAYEAAQQLIAAGEKVSLLAIYDAYTPAGRAVRPKWQRVLLHAYCLAFRSGRFGYLRERFNRRRSFAEAKVVRFDAAATNSAKTKVPAVKSLSRLNEKAADAYRPTEYPGSVVVFRATQRPRYEIFYKVDVTNGWGRLARGGIRVIDLPGAHLDMLNAKRSAAAAKVLQRFLPGDG
jgi:thioesterase domain-containing protein/acyl carrier protein